MLTSLVYMQQGKDKKSKKLIKLVNNDEENSWYLPNDLRNFNEIFKKKMCLMIILKFTKKIRALGQIDTISLFRVKHNS